MAIKPLKYRLHFHHHHFYKACLLMLKESAVFVAS